MFGHKTFTIAFFANFAQETEGGSFSDGMGMQKKPKIFSGNPHNFSLLSYEIFWTTPSPPPKKRSWG